MVWLLGMKFVMQEIKLAVLMIADQFCRDIHVLREAFPLQAFVLLINKLNQRSLLQNLQLKLQPQLAVL